MRVPFHNTFMRVCDCLKNIFGWMCLSKEHLWMHVTVWKKFMGECAFLEYLHGWMWVVVTIETTFMGGCTFIEYICG